MRAMHESQIRHGRQNRPTLTARRSATIPTYAPALPDEGSKARPTHRLGFFFDDEFCFRPRDADE